MWTPGGHPYLLHWGLVSHQEDNECRRKDWWERTLAFFLLCLPPPKHHSNLFFSCPWYCAFSSASRILLMREGKEKHWKMEHVPFAAPFTTMVVGNKKVLGAYSLHLCSWEGGEGNVRYGLCLFLSNSCYSPAASLACSFQRPFRCWSSPKCPGSASCFGKEETPLSRTGRDSAAAPQQAAKQLVCYKMMPVCLETRVSALPGWQQLWAAL